MLVSDILNLSFMDLAAIVPGETITPAEQADAFLRLNIMIGNAAIEQLTLPQMAHTLFAVSAGVTSYTLGVGATMVTASRPIRVTGAASVSGNFRQPMEVMSFEKLAATTQDAIASASVLALKLAADNGYPLINLRVFPVPAPTPGSLWLDYWTAMAQFAAVGDTVVLPPETLNWLHWGLAVELFPQYSRPGSSLELIASRAQQSKAALVQLNQSILGIAPQAAA